MAFDDLDHIDEFGKEVFEENKLTIERPHLVISERRSEYITLIYLDEGDNPRTWIMSDYWDEEKDGENLVVRTKSFTDLMLIFFSSTLKYHTAGFHFVTEEESKDEEIIQKRYLKWFKSLKKIADSIGENKVTNTMVRKLNERFMSYYLANEAFINEKLNENNNVRQYHIKTEHNTNKEKQVKSKPFVNRKMAKELLEEVQTEAIDKLIAIGFIIILIFIGIGIAMLLP